MIFLHYLTIPIKLAFCAILGIIYHLFQPKMSFNETEYPNLKTLINDRDTLLRILQNHIHKTIDADILVVRAKNNKLDCGVPDHQILRHATLMWTTPSKRLLNALKSFIRGNGSISRGLIGNAIPSEGQAPPAMFMSAAFIISEALRHNIEIDDELKAKYLLLTDYFINTFKTPNVKSTGFDAIYAISILSVACKLDSKYKRQLYKYLFLYGFIFMLAFPIIYFPKHRNYFIDHVSMFGLHVCYHNTSGITKLLSRIGIKFVHFLSYNFGNPYFTALAYECKAVSYKYALSVMSRHANSSILECSVNSDCDYQLLPNIDWTTNRDEEFIFDVLRGAGTQHRFSTNNTPNPLSGLCLYRCFEVILNIKT